MRQPDQARSEVSSASITLGRIIGFYGVQGWVKVHSDTDPRGNILKYDRWSLRKGGRDWAVDVVQGRPQGKTLVAQIDGFADRDAAAVLIGADIVVSRQELPTIAADEFYWADLVGCEVIDQTGLRFGRVIRLFETGANDVMVVADERTGDADRAEILIPWVRPDVIGDIDLDARRIEVDWDPDY